MNAPFLQGQTEARSGALRSMPTELEALAPPPLLLPGESLKRYQLMRQAILIELAPRSAIECRAACDRSKGQRQIYRPDLPDPSPRTSSARRRTRLVAPLWDRTAGHRFQIVEADSCCRDR